MKRQEQIGETFSELLKTVRERRNKTQAEVAENIDEIRQTIYDIENCRKMARLNSLGKIAEAYELEVDELVELLKYSVLSVRSEQMPDPYEFVGIVLSNN